MRNQRKKNAREPLAFQRKQRWWGILVTMVVMVFTSLGLTGEVLALSLPLGATQVGTINNAPVIKSPTSDTSSKTFKDIVSALLEGVGTPPYVVNQVSWTGNSSLYNGKALSSFGQSPTAVFGADGFLPTDQAINLQVGQTAYIQNVGSAIETATGKQIPLSAAITLDNAVSPSGTSLGSALMGAKSQNGVITLAWGSLTTGGSGGGGGSTEGGGIGSGTGDDTAFWFIDSIWYTVTLINSDTGQLLPNETLMPIKLSDIDASQLATMDGNGVKGYILSKDTALSQSGNGFQSSSDGALIEDTIELSTNSYIVLKQWNSNSLQYKYTNGKNDYLDIVTGMFGNTPWDLIDLLGGFIEVDKSTLQFGKTPWNSLYSFDKISFDVLDKDGKVVDTIQLNAQGKGTSKRIPQGDYTLREKSSNWTSTGQTVRPDVTVTVKPGETVTTSPKNVAVTGEITVKKTGVESGSDVWNERYTLAGNTFKLTSKTDGKTYTITTDKTGTAVKKGLPLGEYTVEETAASPGFVNTFKTQTVKLTYKDNKTEIVYGETAGTNKEIKGQNTLQKVDKDTELEQNGKADLKTAKYQLFYGDDSNGSSKHKTGDPVKWTDTPKPELLIGEKVTQAVIGGNLIEFGDQVVIDVDDTTLKVGVGNLPIGKFYWLEVEGGEGYVVDPTKHYFEITKKDDQTATIITPDTRSEEQVIDAAIKLNKMFTLPNNEGSSGFNDIEFVATPREGTIAEPVVIVTGVDPVTGDDGYGLGNLVYGDYVLEEKSEPEGRKKIRPIYIHMETNAEKDILTISASYYEDYSKPYSIRKFALQDSATEKNPNSQGTVGSVNSERPTISLSTLHMNNNPDEEIPPTPPTKDVIKVDDGESINEGNVALASDFIYVLNSSIVQPKRNDLTVWTIDDDYDENFERYNGTFRLYAATDFDSYKKGDELPNKFVKAEDKEGKLLFTAQKEFLDVINRHKDKVIGFTIHVDFYRFKDSNKVVNTFVETINKLNQESNDVFTKTPKPQPHKFDLSAEKFDLTGDKLLDNDKEMKDRYEESNKDPYADKTDNNLKENINTTKVKLGQVLIYQLWLDTTPFDETSELTNLRMVDTYDKTVLTVDPKKVKVYDAEGKDKTEFFKIEDKDGQLTVAVNVFKEATNSKGETVEIVDTEKLPLGQIYKIDAAMTVKDSVKAEYDIINTAKQEWTDSEGTESNHITEKRVNKVEGEKKPSIIDKVLPKTGDSPTSIFIKLVGWTVVFSVLFLKRKEIIYYFRKVRFALKK